MADPVHVVLDTIRTVDPSEAAAFEVDVLVECTVDTLDGVLDVGAVLVARLDGDQWEVRAARDHDGFGLASGTVSSCLPPDPVGGSAPARPGTSTWCTAVAAAMAAGGDVGLARHVDGIGVAAAAPVRAPAGGIVGVVAALDRRADDISREHRRLLALVAGFLGHGFEGVWRHRELEVQRDLDAKRRADSRRLVTEVAHDFRTPLAVIASAADLLEAGGQDEEGARHWSRSIASNARRLTSMVDGLLEAERREAPTLPEHAVELDLAALVAQVAAETSRLVDDTAVTVRSGGGGTVVAPPMALRRLLLNLTANAAKSTRSGSITIEATVDDDGATLRVSDTGPGMTADEVARFSRVHVTGDDEGFGLGLAIVRRLAASLGARLVVSSDPGSGTTFAVTLP